MWMTLTVRADRAQFCNPDCIHNSCSCFININDPYTKRVYVPVKAGHRTNLTITNNANVPLQMQVAIPHADTSSYALLTSSDIFEQTPSKTSKINTSIYYPLFQTAEFYISKNGSSLLLDNNGALRSGPTTLSFFHLQDAPHLNLLVKIGHKHRYTFMEILTLPMAQFNTHGYYWTECGYYWIFTIVGFASSTLFVLLSRLQLWQGVSVYAAGSFSIIFVEKLYHAILAARQVWKPDDFAFTVVVITFLAEVIPLVISLVFTHKAVCQPLSWSALGVMTGSGFLFLAGSGWFVGPGMLIAAALTRICRRTVRCTI